MERRSSPTNITTDSSEAPTLDGAQNSDFTDSALDMDVTVPAHTDSNAEYTAQIEPSDRIIPSPSSISPTVCDRLKKLGTRCAIFERDGNLSEIKRRKLDLTLTRLEALLSDDVANRANTTSDPQSTSEDEADQSGTEIVHDNRYNSATDTDNDTDEAELSQVHVNLTAVVQSMRLRQQEQRHLHQLTVQKVEAVAHRCLFQEQQIQDLVEEMRSLQVENHTLGQENDRLRETVTRLQSEAAMKEVAVSAMTSAVAGLEGWIQDANSVHAVSRETKATTQNNRQRRTVVRGKGRFRGRHYVDDEHRVPGRDFMGQDVQELQDGVRAWIRGFKDVEDACNAPVAGRIKEMYRAPVNISEDDWGEFEAPSSFSH